MVYGETGTQELVDGIKQRMVAFWCRMLTGKKNLSFTMYNLLKCMGAVPGDPLQSDWISMVKKTLTTAGFSNLWTNEMDGFDSRYIKSALKLRLNDNAKMFGNAKCTNYRMFKSELNIDSYLLNVNYTDRVALCKFCCRNHSLPVTNNIKGIPRIQTHRIRYAPYVIRVMLVTNLIIYLDVHFPIGRG